MSDVVFEAKNLTKQFTGTLALSDFNLKLYKKKIHAIVGENGAGKSTFCHLMTGNVQPTSGEMYLNGKKVEYKSPKESLADGLCMLYQERNMVQRFTGIQNICLGGEPCRFGGILNVNEARKRAYKLSEDLGVDLPLDVPVGDLSAGTQQMIEILRAFYHDPVLLVLDEPTASLGEGEVEPFLSFVRRARDEMGLTIIYITHKLEEVFRVADQVTVLTDGKLALSKPIPETNIDEVISAMLRRAELDPVSLEAVKLPDDAKPVMKVGPCVYDGREHQLGFELYNGQVTGFYGLVGSGRTECAEMLFGIRRSEKVSIEYNGEKLSKASLTPAGMIKKGVILTPESRANGIFRLQTVERNISILYLNDKYTSKPFAWVKNKKLRALAEDIVQKHNIKASEIDQYLVELSGGNMQKTVIGRSIEIENSNVLMLDEPTNGIDIGAKYEIYRKIRFLAEKQNSAILFISSEINELLSICDRIYVFYAGDIVGKYDRSAFSKVDILNLALGRGHQNGH